MALRLLGGIESREYLNSIGSYFSGNSRFPVSFQFNTCKDRAMFCRPDANLTGISGGWTYWISLFMLLQSRLTSERTRQVISARSIHLVLRVLLILGISAGSF